MISAGSDVLFSCCEVRLNFVLVWQARSGFEFLRKHAKEKSGSGRVYFAVAADGSPVSMQRK